LAAGGGALAFLAKRLEASAPGPCEEERAASLSCGRLSPAAAPPGSSAGASGFSPYFSQTRTYTSASEPAYFASRDSRSASFAGFLRS